MTTALLRLPPVVLGEGALDRLVECATTVPAGWTVLVGPQRTAEGHELDAFVVAAALARRTDRPIGIATRVGTGRAASMLAREATAAQLLGGCAALLLEGDPAACRDAATVIAVLFTEGVHTVSTATAHVAGARNLPVPDVAGGPPLYWREHDELWRHGDDGPSRCGRVHELAADAALPAAAGDLLVVLDLPVGGPDELARTLAR